MKDSETIIIKAFFAALSQQQSPLPANLEQQLTEIAQSLATRILDLDKLAKAFAPLKDSYQAARLYFSSNEAERSKKLIFYLLIQEMKIPRQKWRILREIPVP